MTNITRAKILLTLAIAYMLIVLLPSILQMFPRDFMDSPLLINIIAIVMYAVIITALYMLKKIKQTEKTSKLYSIMIIVITIISLLKIVILIMPSQWIYDIYKFFGYDMTKGISLDLNNFIFAFAPIPFFIAILQKEGSKNNSMILGFLIIHIIDLINPVLTYFESHIPEQIKFSIVFYAILFPLFYLVMFLWALGAVKISLEFLKQSNIKKAQIEEKA